ncbi:MAG: hypothetical protein GXY61_06565 [Lentisphaerae bacterium]|jgi:hypothetical protein|nr:hypothetical protein [Lentisphaerota bacterium]
MILAICYNCGEKKFGAFCRCPKCNVEPESEYDKATSLAITDHYLSVQLLEKTGTYIKEHGRTPEIPQEVRADMTESIRKSDAITQRLKDGLERTLGKNNNSE